MRNALLFLTALWLPFSSADAAPKNHKKAHVAAPAAPAADPSPAMWKLADDDTTIYLFGTIHVLPANVNWRSEKFDNIVAQSEELYVEIADDVDFWAVMSGLGKYGLDKDAPPLKDRIDPDLHDELDAAIAATFIPPSGFDNFKTWLAAVMLMELSDYGLDDIADGDGVEVVLEREFKQAGKPIHSLEDFEGHYLFFDKMSEATQVAFLESMLVTGENVESEFRDDVEAWRTGNVEADLSDWFGEAESDEERAAIEEFIDGILYGRNASWVDFLIDRLDQPGTILVTGGAAHFRGEKSVLDLLAKKGFAVERIQ